jgi:hypothetical protein
MFWPKVAVVDEFLALFGAMVDCFCGLMTFSSFGYGGVGIVSQEIIPIF